MKPTIKKLYIIGLCIFCLGEIIGILKLLYELFVDLPNGSLIGVTKEYISTLLWTTIISIVIKIILAFIIVFMITRILKNVKSKCLIPLLCFSIVFLVITLTSFSLPDIPEYLIYSKLGMIDTYLVYFMNYLTNGTILCVASYIIIIVASIQTLKQKKKETENNRDKNNSPFTSESMIK